jgi:hypothetical protein
MINLKNDITFCVAYCNDSKKREENFKIFLDYWKEAVNVIYKEETTNFCRPKIINELAKTVKTPYLAIVDIDCIIDYNAIVDAIQELKNNDICYPYSKIINVDQQFRKIYTWKNSQLNTKNLKLFFDNVHDDMYIPDELIKNNNFLGLIICFKTESFVNFGAENTNIIGWGFDDFERYIRAKKFNYKISRLNYNCLHLDHCNTQTSRKNKLWKNNYFELLKIYNMNLDEVKEYVKTWS